MVSSFSDIPLPQLIESTPRSLSDIQNWIAEQVGMHIGVEADEVDLDTPFSQYGLCSVQAMSIAIAGKQRFGIEISPLIMWNFPTIASLSSHIAEEFNDSDRESFEI